MEKETEQKINQIQLMEQNMQQFLTQRQHFQSQLVEIESALNELGHTSKAYRIIGNIMVASDKAELEKDLKSKKEMNEIRIKTIEKQEQKLREKSQSLREEVLKVMEKK